MKKALYVLVPIGILAIAVGLWAISSRAVYSAEVKTYLADAHGLHEGAEVHVAGVQVGKVKSVKVIPSAAPEPVEVVLSLSTTFPLDIPGDSLAFVRPAGVLGGMFVEIDIQSTHGAPIRSGAVLKSVDTPDVHACDVLKTISEAVAKGHGDTSANSKAAPTSKAAPPSSSNSQ
jgi:ABC-type transporter Mla subunit MlaD